MCPFFPLTAVALSSFNLCRSCVLTLGEHTELHLSDNLYAEILIPGHNGFRERAQGDIKLT